MSGRKWLSSPGAKTQSLLGYAALMARNLGRWFPSEEERQLNKSLIGYPHNHIYRLCRKRTIPTFQLYERLQAVTAVYPKIMESFLDLGCCRGYFVLEAARRPSCRVATGIDVHEPFVSISNRVSRYLDIRGATFHLATLKDVSERPQSFGGPFQVVLTLGTYHYLYWGSERYPGLYHDHREILSRLFRVCTDKLIFSARLEVGRLPRSVRKGIVATDRANVYTTASFLKAAAEFFKVEVAGHLGKDPLLLMSKKGV